MEATATLERPTDFTVEDALECANAALRVRRDQALEQVEEETENARRLAKAYALHLEADGDPTKLPEGTKTFYARNPIVNDRLGLLEVYRYWNVSRASRNPISPIHSAQYWRVAEALFSRFGEPLPYSEFATIAKARTFGSNDIRRLLTQIADAGKGTIIPRKTRVGGKVAYLIRERRESDTDRFKDGEYGEYDIPEEKR